ncbi:MAG TPA: LPD38 domain-containing protein [Limnobacter sp.]|nr:LPD38 domain-containing protein [Limnobacter sp.]
MSNLFDKYGINRPQGQQQTGQKPNNLFDRFGVERPKRPDEEPEEEQGIVGSAIDSVIDAGKTLYQGAKSTGRAIGAAGNTVSGDLQDVEEYAARQNEASKEKPEALQRFNEAIERGSKSVDPSAGTLSQIGQSAKEIGKAVIDNPEGAFQFGLEQVPNMAAALGPGIAGAKAGAAFGALGGPLAPITAPVGGVLGFATGMFLGNAALETGFKAIEKAEGGFTQAEADEAISEGAVKGGVVTAVDVATLGIGGAAAKLLNRAVANAGAKAEARVLADAGVDITNRQAVTQALADPALRQAAQEAGMQAAKATSTIGRRTLQAGTVGAMETVGEGVGEYLGELAATGNASVYDAVVESLAGLSQSAVETGYNVSKAQGNDLDTRGIVRAGQEMQGDTTAGQPAGAPTATNTALQGNVPPEAVTPSADPSAQAAPESPVQAAPMPAQSTTPANLPEVEGRLAQLEIEAQQRELTPQERAEAEQLMAALEQMEQGEVTAVQPIMLDNTPTPVEAGQERQESALTPPASAPAGTANAMPQADITGKKPGSWVIVDKSTGQAVVEMFDASNVAKVNTDRFDIVPAGQYLASLNQQQGKAGAPTASIVPTPQASTVPTEGMAPRIDPAQGSTEQASSLPAGQDQNLQNRDRSRAASVMQMAQIAKDPDFMRLGPSNTPDSGAPMVFAVGDDFVNISGNAFGAQDVAVMSDGQRVPFRYAVVDASKVQPSNFVTGDVNPEFTSKANGTIKALNNGRTAAVRAAYEMGTAGRYQAEFLQRAAMAGIDPQVVQQTPNPMLVRVYSEKDNTVGMAAKSQGQALGMSPSELARQDAQLIDSSVLSVYMPGDVAAPDNRDFVRAMVGRMNQAGVDVAGMMTDTGTLSSNGRLRIQAALMHAAFDDSDLVQEMFDSLDTDIKAIGEALKTVAGEWANLRDSVRLGVIPAEMDLTGNLLQAIDMIRRARRDRANLYEMSRQVDIETGQIPDPLTTGLLNVFYTGTYLTRAAGKDKMIAQLRDYINAAMSVSNGADMFGDQIRATDILNVLTTDGGLDNVQAAASAGQPSGGSDPGNGPAQTGDQGLRPIQAGASQGVVGIGQGESQTQKQPSGQGNQTGNLGNAEAFDLTAPTPEQLQAQREQQQERERQAREAEQRAQADDQLGDFKLVGSDRDVDRAEAAGQRNMFDQPTESEQAPATAEQAIRDAFRALPSVTLGAFYPITVEFNGRTQQFLASQRALKGNKAEPAITLLQIKKGKMLADMPSEYIATMYKLDANNNLAEQGSPKVASSGQIKQWRDAGFELPALDSSKPEKAATKPKKQPAVSANKVFTEDAAEKARALLKKKLGQLNAGLDPEILQAGIQLAGYHIERGARTFAAYSKAMIDDLGDAVKPYLKSWYMGVKYDPRAAEFEGLSSAADVEQADINNLGADDVQPTKQGTAGNQPQTDGKPSDEKTVSDDADTTTQGAGSTGQNARGARNRPLGGGGVSNAGPDVGGARGVGGLFDDEGGFKANPVPSGSGDARGGTYDSTSRVEPRSKADGAASQVTGQAVSLQEKIAAQAAAEGIPVQYANKANIDATLPLLNPGQREDVLVAEKRFAKPNGYGMLFTNGTGTGKTLLSLGVIKRLLKQGKENVLVVVPNEAVIGAWLGDAKKIGVQITALPDTKSAGTGVVITTYANFGQNDELAKRDWDMVVIDEAHFLMQNAAAEKTEALAALQAVSLHPSGYIRRASMQNRELLASMKEKSDRIETLRKIANTDDTVDQLRNSYLSEAKQLEQEWIALNDKWVAARNKVEQDVIDRQGEKRTRVLFTSATPFAYEKNVEWAEGYLFEVEKGQTGGYNVATGMDKFMVEHFGYRMRYNKLTEPDAKVDRDLMQRNFNTWLRKQGVLSARMLDVDFDYERKFILVNNGIGQKIDEGMRWLNETDNGRYSFLASMIEDKFDRLNRLRLLEAIKANEAIPFIKAHHALGRKVVVFYDFNVGGGLNIFDLSELKKSFEQAEGNKELPDESKFIEVPVRGQEKGVSGNSRRMERIPRSQLVAEFIERRKDLQGLNFAMLRSPLRTLLAAFPNAGVYNGMPEYKRTRMQAIRDFNDDTKPESNLLLVQKNANAGWSGHDTTGRYPRVMINLGLPTAPIEAIQQEGRVYRTGLASNVSQQYFNTGTNWERRAFGSTISRRAGTAENLAMGEQARGLREAFIEAFEDSDPSYNPSPSDGTGGKERDRELVNTLSEFDRAKALYYAQQKRTSKTKSREGADYFATPEPIGLKMVEFADIRFGEDVLEPSAGHGAIARFFPEQTNRTLIEPSEELASRLSLSSDGKIIDDVFENHNIVNKYDAIVMNPPFGVGGKTAMEHLDRASKHLRDGGRIVALIPEGPMADKRFEQWMYEAQSKPVKPVATLPGFGPVYIGDTVQTRATWAPSGKVTGVNGDSLMVQTRPGSSSAVSFEAITSVAPTGARTKDVRANEDLRLVANISLPNGVFERAGTNVKTRIVVIEKVSDPAKRASIGQSMIDLSNRESVEEVFDAMENLSVAKRLKDDSEATPTNTPKAKSSVRDLDAAAQQAEKAAKEAGVVAGEGDEVFFRVQGDKLITNAPTVKVTTSKGKELEGVLVPDRATAIKVDQFTYAPMGKEKGFLVRLRHVQRPAPAAGSATEVAEKSPQYLAQEPQRQANAVQLDLFADTPPDESQQGPDVVALRKAAADEVRELQQVDTPIAVVLASELAQRQRTTLVGKTITSALDLATLAQVYRNPRFETARAFFLNKDGVVVGQVGVTSRLPASSSTIIGRDVTGYMNEVVNRAKDLGASGVYLLHNHPSGIVDASRADIEMTRAFTKLYGERGIMLQGHVVIDTNTYSEIDPNGNAEIKFANFGEKDFPSALKDQIAPVIDSPQALSAYAKAMERPGDIQIVAVNAQLKVMGLYTLPNQWAQNTKANGLPDKKALLRMAVASNASRMFAVVRDESVAKTLARTNYFLDVVHVKPDGTVNSLSGKLVAMSGSDLMPDAGKREGRVTPDTSLAFEKLYTMAKNTKAAFLRADKSTATKPSLPVAKEGMAEAEVMAVAQRVMKKWANKPEVVVVDSMQDDRVPGPVRDADAQQRAGGASGSPVAFIHRGVVYLIRPNMTSEAAISRALYHEVLGHYGLRGVYGDALNDVLDRIILARPDLLRAKAKEYGIAMTNTAQRREVAEEVLAEMSENNPELGFVRNAVAAIRTWLRNNVPGFESLALSNEEIIRLYIAPARNWVKRGESSVLAYSPTAFSREAMQASGVVDTPVFKRWFGDSKVVDSEGRPLVVYHGTRGDFNEFKPSKYDGGIYFSSDTGEAGEFAVMARNNGTPENTNIVPVYLSMQNPSVIDVGGQIFDEDMERIFRQSIRAAKANGNDGLIVRNVDNLGGVVSDTYIAFDPTQIKSATGNMGTFDPENPDIRFSRKTLSGGVPPTIGPKQQTKWSQAKDKVDQLLSPANAATMIYQVQDRFVDLKNVRKRIESLGKAISDMADAYLGEELYHQRLAGRVKKFLNDEVKPLQAAIRNAGLTVQEVEQYLHARHAPEANKVLAERNPNQQTIDQKRKESKDELDRLNTALQKAKQNDAATKALQEAIALAQTEVRKWQSATAFSGTEAERTSLSGMSDEQASNIMKSLPAAKRQRLDGIAAKVDAMNEKTLKALESYGLMSASELQAWRNTYKYYVPLHRDEAHPEGTAHPIGQGFSVRGSASKSRTGSNAEVTNILTHVIMQRESALARGEKNLVAKRLYLMAMQNPDREFWELDKVPMVSTLDKNGLVSTYPDPSFKTKPNVIVVRIGGKDRAIVFNERNREAVRLAGALKNLDVSDLDYLERTVGQATRWFASINTQYNPVFGAINFTRDVQGAMLNLTTTPIAGKQAQVMALVGPALRTIYRDVRGKSTKNNEMAKYWQEIQEVGGLTGFRDMFVTTNDRIKDLESMMNEADKGAARKAFDASLKWLSDYNETAENAVRLAAYKVARDSGMSKERAASLAKNLTVNFNRRGAVGRKLGVWFAFFNAAVQGTARMAETLAGPAGKAIMLGGVTLGMTNALIAMAVLGGMEGDDEDEDGYNNIPEFVRERSLIIPTGGGKYVAWPMPLGFNVFPNIGRIAAEWAFGRSNKGNGARIGEMMQVIANAFNPLGGSAPLAQMIAPTVMDPIAALLQNRDWTGTPIYREDLNSLSPTPGFSRTKDTASAFSKTVAELINDWTGGTEYRPGVWSPTPDQLDYVIGQLTGGAGRELLKLSQTVAAPLNGDELPMYKIPLVGRLVGETTGPSAQSPRFYENVRELNLLESELRGRLRDGKPVDDLRKDPMIDLIGPANSAEQQVRDLRSMRRQIVSQGLPDAAKETKQINEQIGLVMKDLNRQVNAAQKNAPQ